MHSCSDFAGVLGTHASQLHHSGTQLQALHKNLGSLGALRLLSLRACAHIRVYECNDERLTL